MTETIQKKEERMDKIYKKLQEKYKNQDLSMEDEQSTPIAQGIIHTNI